MKSVCVYNRHEQPSSVNIRPTLWPSVLECVCTLYKVPRQLVTFPACLMTGPELSAGDGLWGLRIYPLHVGRKPQLHPDRLGLVPAAKPSLFNRVRLGRVCLLTQWNVHEDEGKTFSNPGRHWRPGRRSSAFDTKPHFLWHIFEALSMKCVIIQNNRDTALKRWITIKEIAAFLCFLTDLHFFKSEELSSSVLTDTQYYPFT